MKKKLLVAMALACSLTLSGPLAVMADEADVPILLEEEEELDLGTEDPVIEDVAVVEDVNQAAVMDVQEEVIEQPAIENAADSVQVIEEEPEMTADDYAVDDAISVQGDEAEMPQAAEENADADAAVEAEVDDESVLADPESDDLEVHAAGSLQDYPQKYFPQEIRSQLREQPCYDGFVFDDGNSMDWSQYQSTEKLVKAMVSYLKSHTSVNIVRAEATMVLCSDCKEWVGTSEAQWAHYEATGHIACGNHYITEVFLNPYYTGVRATSVKFEQPVYNVTVGSKTPVKLVFSPSNVTNKVEVYNDDRSAVYTTTKDSRCGALAYQSPGNYLYRATNVGTQVFDVYMYKGTQKEIHSTVTFNVTAKPAATPTPTPTPTPSKPVSGGTTGTQTSTKIPSVNYTTHVQSIGWQSAVKDGAMAGTQGQSKRLEAICISLSNLPCSGGIQYRTHVQTYGWQGWKADGAMAGTSGEGKRLEAIQIQLTGEIANQYDVYYQTHIQHFGWSGWAKNGEQCGSAGYSYRLEGIRIKLVKKGSAAPGAVGNIYFEKNNAAVNGSSYYNGTLVKYNTHVQTYGWQNYVVDGAIAGTQGQSKRLEGIHIELTNKPYSGGIQYRTHVQTYGWQGWQFNGGMAGTSGESKRLEAIQIKLTGEMANHYDVYYQTHIQKFGWTGWAKNGEQCGSAGYSYRLEGIRIMLVQKGGKAPGSTANKFFQK